MQLDSADSTSTPDADGAGFRASANHRIVAGAALLAALAGVGITAAIDYPWHVEAVRPWRARPADVAVSPPAAVAAVPAAATLPAAAPRPAAQPHAAPAPVAKARAARRAPVRSAGHHAAGVPSAAPAPARSIDAQYDRVVAAECPRGLQGVLCREAVRWRVCHGHWNAGGAAGASRCNVGDRASAFPPAG